MDPPRWRCFVALPVPTTVAQDIERRLAGLHGAWPDARWVPTGDLHVTLAFLGATPVDRLPAVEGALGEVARSVRAFEIGLLGAGAFGGRRRPRVAWLGIGQGETAVRDLVTALGIALAMVPRTASRPHLTLARGAHAGLTSALSERFADGRPAWAVDELVLYRSHLGPPRARYEVLVRWTFGGHDGLPRSGRAG
ncbi:MAG TPA: RNA 2',3'-cyclic phosphodiesterase [Candidatus Saccharimonadia bacterium]|nr:RNA 2',3'-cyclic phosphodiesterase [Candidatus Saccharimonadia bacterium]